MTVAAVALAMLPAPAPAAKPDLIIARQATVSPDYFFRGEGTNAAFTDRTKNKGKAKAGRSKTSLVLVHTPEVRGKAVASRNVPKLKPGESDFGQGGDSLPDSLPPGAYDAIACADHKDKVKEKNEDNNCADLGRVHVIVRSWFGFLNGSGPTAAGGNVTETWESGDMTLEFIEDLGDGRFRYGFSGPIRYTVSGTDSLGCDYSGSDTTTVAPDDVGGQGLVLDYRKEEYFGNSGIGSFPFTWTQSCPDGFSDPVPGPLSVAGGFIVVNPQEVDLPPMPFGSTALQGAATNDNNQSTFGWLLGAGN